MYGRTGREWQFSRKLLFGPDFSILSPEPGVVVVMVGLPPLKNVPRNESTSSDERNSGWDTLTDKTQNKAAATLCVPPVLKTNVFFCISKKMTNFLKTGTFVSPPFPNG